MVKVVLVFESWEIAVRAMQEALETLEDNPGEGVTEVVINDVDSVSSPAIRSAIVVQEAGIVKRGAQITGMRIGRIG